MRGFSEIDGRNERGKNVRRKTGRGQWPSEFTVSLLQVAWMPHCECITPVETHRDLLNVTLQFGTHTRAHPLRLPFFHFSPRESTFTFITSCWPLNLTLRAHIHLFGLYDWPDVFCSFFWFICNLSPCRWALLKEVLRVIVTLPTYKSNWASRSPAELRDILYEKIPVCNGWLHTLSLSCSPLSNPPPAGDQAHGPML